MKKAFGLFVLGVVIIIVGSIIGLIQHNLLGPSLAVSISLPAIGIGIFFCVKRDDIKPLFIWFNFAIAMIGAGSCWALWIHHLVAGTILVSLGFLLIMGGSLRLFLLFLHLPKFAVDYAKKL